MSKAYVTINGTTQTGESAETNVVVKDVGNSDRAKVVALSRVSQTILDTASGSTLFASAKKTSVQEIGGGVYEVRVRYEAATASANASEKVEKLWRSWSSASETATIHCPIATTRQVGDATAPHATIGPNDEGVSVPRGFTKTNWSFIVNYANVNDSVVAARLRAYLFKVNSTAFLGADAGCVLFDGFDLSPQTERDGVVECLLKLEFSIRDVSDEVFGLLPTLEKDGWDVADVKYTEQLVSGSGTDGGSGRRLMPVSAASLQVFDRADLNDLLGWWASTAIRGSVGA